MCIVFFFFILFFFLLFFSFIFVLFFFLMIRRPPRSTLDRSSAASDVYKRQVGAVLAEQDPALSMLTTYCKDDVPGKGYAPPPTREGTGRMDYIFVENPTPEHAYHCLLYTSPSPRDRTRSRMPSSA